MHLLDVAIVIAYLLGTVLFCAWFSRNQHDVKDYFVGGMLIGSVSTFAVGVLASRTAARCPAGA